MDNNQNTTPTTKGMGTEKGLSGTLITGGIITQEEYNQKLVGENAIRIYDTMRRSDATVRATLQVCKLPIMSALWDIEPASDDEADEKIANFIKRELFDRNVTFEDFQRQALTMFDFGYSVFEKVLELTEDEDKQLRIGIKKLGFRKQKSILSWETKDHKLGITQQLLTTTVDIPMEKLIVFTNDKEGDNYEGISLLRYAYKHWDIKDKLDRMNAIALETHARGVPVLKKPSSADESDLAKARKIMRNFRINEEGYIEIPEGWTVEMLDMKSQSTKDVLPTINYHDRQITMSVLAQFLSLGASDASGSRAVSQDHSKLFLLSEEATAKNLQKTIQDQLIKVLCDLNFSNLPNGYPKLVFSKIGDDDIAATATAIKDLMTAGAIHADPDLEQHIRETLKLPELPETFRESFEKERKASESSDSEKKDVPAVNPEDKDKLPTEKKNADPKKQQEVIEASIKQAKEARKKLIDVIVG